MDPNFRLRTATRLHFLLLRRYGQNIDVDVLLSNRDRLHDGLWLCEAIGDTELIGLALQLAEANRRHEAAEAEAQLRAVATEVHREGADGLHELPWGDHTTNFGLTMPLDLPPLPHFKARRRWFNPVRWLRAGLARPHA